MFYIFYFIKKETAKTVQILKFFITRKFQYFLFLKQSFFFYNISVFFLNTKVVKNVIRSENGRASHIPFSPKNLGRRRSPINTNTVLLKTESILAAFALSLD